MDSQPTCNTTTALQPTCNTTTALGPEVPFIPFLAGLTAWALLKFAAEFIVQRVNPQFFEDLKMDARRKYDLYFGTWLGIIFKAVSITACTASLFTVSAETDIAGLVRPLNTAEQWCWGCRAVLYIQELPHIASIPELVIHHILSIGAMMAILTFNIPRRQMYVAWAGLWSEFVNSARRLFKMHGKLSQRLSWWFGTANFLLLVAFRVTGCFFAVVWTLQSGTRGMSLIIDIGSWTIYFVYMLQVSIWEAYRTKLVVLDFKSRPAKIIIAEKWDISLYGIIMGLGFVCTELSALLMYEVNSKPLNTVGELQSIAWATIQAALVGMIGGYIVPMGLRSYVLNGKRTGQEVKQVRQSSKVGGFLFAAATLMISPTISDSIDRRALLACVVLSWPLLDAVGYIGSYFEGVGSGRPSVRDIKTGVAAGQPLIRHAEKSEARAIPGSEEKPQQPEIPDVPLQLIGSILSGTLYICFLEDGFIDEDRYQAALLVIGLRSTIRRVILPRRKDITLTTIQLPFMTSPVELHRIWSLATVMFSLTALLIIKVSAYTTLHEDPPNRYTIFGAPLSTYIITSLFSVSIIGLFHVFSEFLAEWFSHPRDLTPRKRSSPGEADGKQSEKRGDGFTSPTKKRITRSRSGSRGKKIPKTILNPKFIASAAGAGLVLLIILAVCSDSMPKVITSVEDIGSAAGNFGGSDGASNRFYFLLEVVSSWQFVVSTFGVAILPVVLVQLVH